MKINLYGKVFELTIKIVIIVIFFSFLFLLMSDCLPFSSQNAFYHTVFADNIFNRSFLNTGILESSIFSQRFIDQHIGYHFLIWLANFMYHPELAIKILTSLVLSLALFQLIKEENKLNSILMFALFGFFLTFFFKSFSRIFWERPQFLNIFIFVYFITRNEMKVNKWFMLPIGFFFAILSFESAFWVVFSSFALFVINRRQNRQFLYLAMGALVSLFAFPFGFEKIKYLSEILINNIFFEKNISEWSGGRSWDTKTIALTAAIFSTFYIPTKFITPKINLLRLCSLVFLVVSLKFIRFEYLYLFFAFLLFAEIAIVNLSGKLKSILAIVIIGLSTLFYMEIKQTYKGNVETIYDTSKFVKWFQGSRYSSQKFVNLKWEYWSSLLYYNKAINSEPGYSMFIYKKNELIYNSYQFFRNEMDKNNLNNLIKLFAGFKSKFILVDNSSKFLQIYKTKKWPFVALYQDENFTFLEFLDTRDTFTIYNENKEKALECLSVNNCAENMVKRKNSNDQIDIFIPLDERDHSFPYVALSKGHFAVKEHTSLEISGSEDFFLTRFKSLDPSNRQAIYYEYPFYKINGQWKLAEKNLLTTDIERFLNRVYRLYDQELNTKNKSMFYVVGEDGTKDSDGRLRKLLGVMSICLNRNAYSTCLNLIQNLNVNNLKNWDLGSKSILGLIGQHLKTSDLAKINKSKNNFFSLLPELVLQHFDSNTHNWYLRSEDKKEILINNNYVFAVGEALTYLSYKNNELQWHALYSESEKYYLNFIKTRNVYSIRWLLSMLYYQLGNNSQVNEIVLDKVKQVIAVIYQDYFYSFSEPKFFSGCYINNTNEASVLNFDHHSGLLLEGLSYFATVDQILKERTYQELVYGFAKCTLRQQILKENYKKFSASAREVGGVRVSPDLNKIRVDVLAHLAIGFYQLNQQEKIKSLLAKEEFSPIGK